MIPQLIWLIFMGIVLGKSINQHGTTTERKHRLGWDLFGMLLVNGLLYWGGFFTPSVH